VNFIKKHWLLTSLVLVALTATAAKIGDDLVKIGKPGSTADKSIVFDVGDGATNPSIVIDTTDKDFDFNKAVNIAGDLLKVGDGTNSNKEVVFDIGSGVNNPRFRWNSVNNVLEFALDGTTFRAIGSGSGGASGVNLLAEANFDFELGDPPDDWTASGGTFSADSSTPIFGDQSGAWDSDASAQTLCSSAVQIERGFLGRTCQAEIEYRYDAGTAADYKLSAVDTGSEVATIDLALTPSGEARKAQLVFDCPDTNTDTLQLCLESQVADADPIEVDETFIGTGRNTFNFSQAQIIAAGNWGACTPVSTSTSEVFVTSAGCTAPQFTVLQDNRVEQGVDYNGPRVVINNARPGTYKVTMMARQARIFSSVNTLTLRLRLNGSTLLNQTQVRIQDDNDINGAIISGATTITTPQTLTFEARTFQETAVSNHQINYESGDNAFIIEYFPLNSSEAITLETSGQFWKVDISGGNPNLGTGNESNFRVIPNGSLSMVVDSTSAPATIPCIGGASTGLTCSGSDEIAGINFNAPTAGRYQVCGSFNHQLNLPTGGQQYAATVVFKWVETQAGNYTNVLQEGLSNHAIEYSSGGGGNTETNLAGNGFQLCETFVFDSAGEKSLQLFYKQDNMSNIDTNLILANNNVNRTMTITVQKMDQQFPTPVFTDLQNSLASKVESADSVTAIRMVSAEIDGNPASVIKQDGSWITSVTDGGVGVYTVNIAPGVFTSTPNCVISPIGNNRCMRASPTSTTSITVTSLTCNAAVAADASYSLICVGGTN
jgi:hypothetical protein